jgi:glutaredoxin-like protein DUF836
MSHRVVLYTQPNCTLCDEARALLDRIGHGYSEAFEPRYALRVPVIEVDGRVVAEAPVDERAVRRVLRRAR